MRICVLLAVTLAAVANGQLRIFPRQFGESLNITCANENQASHNLSNVVSLVITKYQDGVSAVLASISSFKTLINHVTEAKVTGSMNGSNNFDSNITIHWEKAKSYLDGSFSCTLFGLDQDNVQSAVTDEFVLKLQDMDPVMRVTPSHIEAGLTPSLIIECSLSNVAIFEISELLEVQLFQEINGTNELIAKLDEASQLAVTLNISQNFITTPGTRWTVLSSYFEKSKALYLSIKQLYPTSAEAGTYTCNVRVVGNTTDHIVRTTSVTASVSTGQDIYNKFIDQEGFQDYFLFLCDFENGLCGLTATKSSNLTGWTIMSDRVLGRGLHFQSSPNQYAFGHYLYLNCHSLYGVKIYSIETKLIPPIRRPICVNFWFLVTGNVQNLNLYTRQNGTLQNVFSQQRFFDRPWRFIEIVLPPAEQAFSLLLEAQGSFNTDCIVALDDFIITDFNCRQNAVNETQNSF